jgi:Flp pilus assembly protein TadD
MRFYTVASLALGLFFQVGCAALTLSPNATPMRLRAYNEGVAARYISANDFERQEKFEQAREIYQDLHEKHPKNPDYLHRLAVVNTRLQRYDEASNFYERARQADPKNVRLLADMGYSASLRGELQAAEQVLREALHLKPGDRRVINNLAIVVASRGQMEECLTLLKETGDEAEALGSMAYIHAMRGETSLAEARYREALAINPNLKYATNALAELSKRHSGEEFTPVIPPDFDSNRLDPVVAEVVEVPDILQVSTEINAAPRKVVTAGFEQPSFDSGEPDLLNENPEIAEQSNDRVKPAAIFDDQEPADVETSTNASDTTISEPNSQDDTWAND